MKLSSVSLLSVCYCITINHIAFFGHSFASETTQHKNLTSDADGDDDSDYDNYDYDSEYDETDAVVATKLEKTSLEENNLTSIVGGNAIHNSVDETSDSKHSDDSFSFVDFYTGIVSALYENITVNAQNTFGDSFFAALTSPKLSHQCKQSTLRVLRAIYQRKLWAIKFLDSTAQLPNGLAEGVFSSLGDYDECIEIKSKDNGPAIHGKYCLAEPVIDVESIMSPITVNSAIENHLPLDSIQKFESSEESFKFNANTLKLVLALNATRFAPFRVGLCVPSDCSAEDIEAAINIFVNPTIKIPIRVGPQCDSKVDPQRLNWYQIASIIFFCVTILLVAIGTTGELVFQKLSKTKAKMLPNNANQHIILEETKFKKFSTAFSLITNTKSLFSKPSDRLAVADTMFFLFIVWIFLGRIYCAPLTINLLGLKKIFSSLVIQITSSEKYFWLRTPFPLAVLFFVGGLFISYDFFGREIKNKNIFFLLLWYLKFIIEKWLRFVTRVIGPLMLFYLLSILGSGPYWRLGEHFFIKSDILPNIFFYTNHANTIESYINHPSLHLSALFQLQCVFPLFMIPLLFSKRYGISYNILLAIVGSLLIVLPRVVYGIKIAPFEVNDMRFSEVRKSLIRYSVYAVQHVCQFSIGILTGYLLRNRKILSNAWFIKSTSIRQLFSIASLVLCSLTIVWGDSFKNLNTRPNLVNLLLWFSVGNLLFSVGIAWICYTICINTDGVLHKLFSCKYVRPLNRLSVGILLIHSDIIYFRIFNLRENYAITNAYAFQSFYIDFLKTVLLAYLLYILFEKPIINLIHLIKSTPIKCTHNRIDLKKNTTDHRNYYRVFPLQNGNILNNAKDIELERLNV